MRHSGVYKHANIFRIHSLGTAIYPVASFVRTHAQRIRLRDELPQRAPVWRVLDVVQQHGPVTPPLAVPDPSVRALATAARNGNRRVPRLSAVT